MFKHLALRVMPLIAITATNVAAQTAEEGAATDDESAAELFTTTELETMVAPVALYPDTLLMQILVASTVPLDIMKAEQHLRDNPEEADQDRKDFAEAQDWDESVQALAAAFPDVLDDMAEHVDWTETMGNAMLTQSDDVMDAIQAMRQLAIENGTLVSGDQQTVDVQQNDLAPAQGQSDTGTAAQPQETVVITPTDPQTVYVPQYNPSTVYSPNLGGVIATTAVAFGTAALIDDIFDDDDDWGHYWGCRDCGGWNGRPIVRDPDIDLDVDGNVNIGNRVNIDRDNARIDRTDIGWKPDSGKAASARKRIENNRNGDGSSRLPVKKAASRQDNLRKQISGRTGAPDLGRDPGQLAQSVGSRPPNRANAKRPAKFNPAEKSAAVKRTKTAPKASHPKAAAAKASHPKVSRPAPKKTVAHHAAAPRKPAVTRHAVSHAPALHKHSSGTRARAASHRGHVSRGHRGRR
ncbi:DUF3300 domain-containing protein [Paracoccus sp. Z330]|uniref:DUF3300 domain-containing protein n=1 Tax=Paracoccus onchidii TaxID=3017813 RepID=A0ABT4ZJ15_9RHOB|nr:DUF3300 domain-containing protein [Paracoccus onchidii]MDB6179354.1 DUF3300 domain-containing protein [Paracoccus onchidii]